MGCLSFKIPRPPLHRSFISSKSPSAYRSPTIFAFYCGGIVSPVSACSTIRGREVQPLAALYPTVRLSPWRQVRKNIHSRVWTPGPTWSVLHPGGPPLLVPLSSCTGGYGPHPRRLIRTPVQGGYPRYHSILYPPRRASLLVPLSLDLSASLPPEFCPLPFVCFLCGTRHRALVRKHCHYWKSLLIFSIKGL